MSRNLERNRQEANREQDTPQNRPAAVDDTSSLVWAVPAAAIIPWRAFPAVRRARMTPLLTVYVFCAAASLALTFAAFPWKAAGPLLTWQTVLLQRITGLVTDFATVYVLLTLSVSSSRQRVRETFAIGLRLTLAAKVSQFLWLTAVQYLLRAVGMQIQSWVLLCFVGPAFYMLIAMSLSAARLAEQDSAMIESDDPLWPLCTTCHYSLRGLPMVEAWLATRNGPAAAAQSSIESPQACPECGQPVAESLRTYERLATLRSTLHSPKHATFKWLLKGIVRLRPQAIAQWVISARRMTTVVLWLLLSGIPAVELTVPMVGRGGPPVLWFMFWLQSLLCTGIVALLAGLAFSVRMRQNVIGQAQAALVPAVLVGGICVLVLDAVFPEARQGLRSVGLGSNYVYLTLGLLTCLMEIALLWRVKRLTALPANKGNQSDDTSA